MRLLGILFLVSLFLIAAALMLPPRAQHTEQDQLAKRVEELDAEQVELRRSIDRLGQRFTELDKSLIGRLEKQEQNMSVELYRIRQKLLSAAQSDDIVPPGSVLLYFDVQPVHVYQVFELKGKAGDKIDLGGNQKGDEKSAGTMYAVLVRPEKPVEGTVVSDVRVASGREYRPLKLREGDLLYSDRSYTILYLPPGYEDLTWVQTANNDQYDNSSDGFVTFKLETDATVYVAHDIAKPTPAWLTQRLKPASYRGAGGGRAIVQIDCDPVHTFDIYSRPVKSGEAIRLGPDKPPDVRGAGMMYLALLQTDQKDPLDVVGDLTFPANRHYTIVPVVVGQKPYTDRDYTLVHLPAELRGCLWLRMANDDDDRKDSAVVSMTAKSDFTLYILHDRLIKAKPEWLTDGFTLVERLGR